MPADRPALSAVVVHWRNEQQLATLLAGWPSDPRFELLVVDNSASLGPLPAFVRRLDPGVNLGFAAGVNRGVAAARAPIVLLLNPDVYPLAGALDRLLEGFHTFPDAAGLAPALTDPDGTPQSAWQLRPLPSPRALVLQTWRFVAIKGPTEEPPPGTVIAQPAAAALALKKEALSTLGGMDERYYPAWFEDVDLARRLHGAGLKLRYLPAARFVHETGATVPRLGYGPFLWAYYRNLDRYLIRHHGTGWARLARLSLPFGMVLRLLLLPLRRPRQCPRRLEAAAGLLAVCSGALSSWRWPAAYRRRFQPPGGSGEGGHGS